MINRAEVIKKRNDLKYIIDYLSCARYNKDLSKKENDKIDKALRLARNKYNFFNNLLKTPINKENEDDRDRIKTNTIQN